MTAPVQSPSSITLFTTSGQPLAKQFWADNGKIHKQAVATLYEGRAETIPAPTARALEDLLSGLSRCQAIASGVLIGRESAVITTRNQARYGAATRSLENFHFPKGPGWLLWDYDDKTMPADVTTRIDELGGPLAALFEIWPEARDGAYLVRPSSSDGVTAPGCGELSSSGMHGFFRVSDVSRSRDMLNTLEVRAWAKGLAWIALSKSGAMLVRSIVDVAVGSPERLIFEAPPILHAPVTRIARPSVIQESEIDLTVPKLQSETAAQAREAERIARHRIRPKADMVEEAFVEDRARQAADRTGSTFKAARIAVQQMMQGASLDDEAELQLPSGQWLRVGEILDNLETYDRRGIPDPVEGLENGADKATLLLRPRPGRPDEKPCLVSHARGLRTVYHFARFERPPARPPFYPEPGGRKEDHAATVLSFIDEAARMVRAQKMVARHYEELAERARDLDPQERTRRQAAILRHVRDRFDLEFLPASMPGDGQPCPRTMLSGAQGTGKTQATIRALARWPGIVTLVLQPDHAKAAEFAEEYRAATDVDSPEVIVLRGRRAFDPDESENRMCHVSQSADSLAARGLSPKQVLCPVCPMRNACGHMRQEARLKRLSESPEGVVIVAPSEFAFIPLPGDVTPDMVIFDEAPRRLAADRATISFETLGETLAYEPGGQRFGKMHDAGRMADALEDSMRLVRPLRTALRDAFQQAPDRPLAHMKQAGITDAMIRQTLAALHQFEDRVITAKAKTAFEAATFARLRENRTVDHDARLLKEIEGHDDKAVKAFRQVLEALLPELETGREAANAVLRCENINAGTRSEGVVKGIEALFLNRPHFSANTPLLHLDGTGDHELAERIFGPMERASYRVERNTHVVQVSGRSWSKTSITGNGFTAQKQQAEAATLRRELIDFCHSKPGALVIAPKAVIEALRADGLSNPVAHYNALRGRNEWKDCSTAIVIGREEPTEAVERIGRAFAAADTAPFNSLGRPDGSFGRWDKAARGLRMRDKSRLSVDVNCHPDPWAEKVLRQVRDCELVQGIDRLRPHFKASPVTVFLLAELVLDVTVDRVERWIDLKKGGNRPSRAIEAAGVLPLSDSEAPRLLPGIWRARQTAQEDLPRWRYIVEGLTADFPKSIDYSDFRQLSTSLLVRYRSAPRTPGGRAGRMHHALVWAPPEAARAQLEAVAGELRTFEVVPGWTEALDAAEARDEPVAAIQAESAAATESVGDVAPEPVPSDPLPRDVLRIPAAEEWTQLRYDDPSLSGSSMPP
ncbi:hypothetical protein [Salipiger mucosus]|uniref:Uncharacterized protein n=1 Tax=Salipiger mucosus DSM 16094 TaxID=1123237 RepID=S9Q7X1_9RHOB|nr:hypothetical protein [Salipiger mucosus]EPX75703.1 hypothetical protein Salmuc_01168 [Salipiger mucosus DSM 16094]